MMRHAVAAMAATAAVLCLAPAAHADQTPTLGVAHPSASPYATGLGTARPTGFSLGAVAASTIRNITWDSWGGPQATGHGVRSLGAATPEPEPINLIAKDIGTCGGQLVYRQIEETSPGSSGTTFDIC